LAAALPEIAEPGRLQESRSFIVSKRAHAIVWITLLVILAFPRTGSAGFADLIWEMSGAQLIGLGLECEVGLTSTRKGCRLFEFIPIFRDGQRQDTGLWLAVEARGYFSTWKNHDEADFEFLHVGMAGIDPMLGFGRRAANGMRYYAGAGFSLNRLFGRDFEAFNNFAYKLRPIGVEVDLGRFTLDIAYNLRFYPKGFDVGPSTNNPPVRLGRELERVHGFVVSVF
jgi:hypothetical protein